MLHAAVALPQGAGVVLGVHGAGWANLLFAGPGTYALEMALAEPHAIYAAHLAYALDQHYFWVPLRGAGMHSAARIAAPVARLCRVLREIVREIEAVLAGEIGPSTTDAGAAVSSRRTSASVSRRWTRGAASARPAPRRAPT